MSRPNPERDACARAACLRHPQKESSGSRGKVVPQMWIRPTSHSVEGENCAPVNNSTAFEIASHQWFWPTVWPSMWPSGDTGQSQIVLLASVKALNQ